MKITTMIVAAILGFVASVTAQQYFGVVAVHSGSPIHFLSMEAAGERFTLGGTSAHYCPSDIQDRGFCPNTDETNFMGGDGVLYMGALVPGGQQVYVDPEFGALHYTQAQSLAQPIESGNGTVTVTGMFTHVEGESFGTLSWVGTGAMAGLGGFLACNTTNGGPYYVYVDMGTTPPGDCLGFDAITSNETRADAWQYM